MCIGGGNWQAEGDAMDWHSPLAVVVAVVAGPLVIWSVFGVLWRRRERRWRREDQVRPNLATVSETHMGSSADLARAPSLEQ
jgi:hypothetical protein